MPKFKLDGREVDFEPGEAILEAAARHGVPIPFYCYHPDLTSPANCRMCLVEVTGAPKLVPSCQQPPREGSEVLTRSERVLQAQRDVMEYLLINHPLDCPICDQAGECKLQQYAYLFGPPASSMEEEKVKLEKRKVLGPHVLLDQERCISCTRCVRFCEEITGTRELAMFNRSHFQTVDRHPELELDNAYSGNVVDMCPVGALTDRQFRFNARVWYLQPIDTTCTLCSRGCNIKADRRGERRELPEIKRIRARRNPEVNQSWICDEGRYGYQRPAEGERPIRARGTSKTDADAAYAALDAACVDVGRRLVGGGDETGWLGVLASGAETNEELAALALFARGVDPKAVLVVPDQADEDEDGILRRTDKMANRRGARRLDYEGDVSKLAKCREVLVVDADVRPDHGLTSEQVEAATGGSGFVAMAAHDKPWLSGADVFLPLAGAYEKSGTVVSHGEVLQRVRRVVPPPGDCRPVHRHLAGVAEAAGLPAVGNDAEDWLIDLCEEGGPFAGLEPAELTIWGARLPGEPGGEVELLPEPVDFFPSAPKGFAEGEYGPWVEGGVRLPALHVSAGMPPLVHLEVPGRRQQGMGAGDGRAGGDAATPAIPEQAAGSRPTADDVPSKKED